MTEDILTIVIPMAGRGSRFADAGYLDPKPLIPVAGQPMIKLVIDNLSPSRAHRFVFICQRAHVAEYGLRPRFEAWAPGCAIVELDGITEGAACTVLTARDHIGVGPLMIANSDQYVDIDINDYLAAQDGVDGLIMTMTADDPKWSFVALDDEAHVTRVVEKEVISSEATVGIYNFASGADFIRAADGMIAAGKRVNGEFYVAPAYEELIAEGQDIRIFNVGSEANGMYGLGTPADLDLFKSLGMPEKIIAGRAAASE
jgi:NDP-sugar pyrophosphorylase family protein